MRTFGFTNDFQPLILYYIIGADYYTVYKKHVTYKINCFYIYCLQFLF